MKKLSLGPVSVRGIDVSDYQSPLNWDKAMAEGIKFAFIKASEGLGWRGKKTAEHSRGARAAGVLVGAYHFFHFGMDALKQAENFAACIPPGAELPPVVDVEWADGREFVNDADAESVLAMLEAVEKLTGRTPMIYTAASFFHGMSVPGAFKRFTPWIAHYTAGPLVNVPDPWDRLVFWQNTDSLILPGYAGGKLDGNFFNGSLEDLRAFAASGQAHAAPAPAPTVSIEKKKALQSALNLVGAEPALVIDGVVGPKTKSALRWAADSLS